jgi:hypothetical protein
VPKELSRFRLNMRLQGTWMLCNLSTDHFVFHAAKYTGLQTIPARISPSELTPGREGESEPGP